MNRGLLSAMLMATLADPRRMPRGLRPEPEQPREKTAEDLRRIAAAEEKRKRRAARK